MVLLVEVTDAVTWHIVTVKRHRADSATCPTALDGWVWYWTFDFSKVLELPVHWPIQWTGYFLAIGLRRLRARPLRISGQGKVELLTGIEGASSRPVRRIVLVSG